MTTHSIIQPGTVPAHMNQNDLVCIPPHLVESSIYEHLKSLTLVYPINITGNRPLKSLLRLNLSKYYKGKPMSIFINILKNSPSIQEVKIDISYNPQFLTKEVSDYLIKEALLSKLTLVTPEKKSTKTTNIKSIVNFIKEMKLKDLIYPYFTFIHKIRQPRS
ncbi:hypothetical protein DLAC_09736 [Tieghemostelium lacteum]|uniref:Uncharacterized protein n=1 Tax=Tieghemostelium lacteum TaxID=361077 RepID=A0A151Z761_TIELA|nr:hypothetical protein DLAC_09736 [Tieghemostelium lacteum]|eukprot:KYQ89767.1 hypothetical protein DLAC_09736 [Tieghemostelium lacteum]